MTQAYQSLLCEIEQLRAENAVLVEALKKIKSGSECGCKPLCQCFSEESLRIKIEVMQDIASESLANTSEQAQALLAVVDAARNISKFTIHVIGYEKALDDALAAYDKLKGETK